MEEVNGVRTVRQTVKGETTKVPIRYMDTSEFDAMFTEKVKQEVDNLDLGQRINDAETKVSAMNTKVNGLATSVSETKNLVDEYTDDIATNTANIKTNTEDIAEIINYIGLSKEIVGLQVDYKNKTFKRLANAVGRSAGADFDSFNMYGGRRKCNVADNGTINAFYGDSGYVEDGSNGQVMVYQPKFYYCVIPLEIEKQAGGKGYHLRKANYYVSDLPRTGFKVHPAFIDANGNEVDYVFIGSYEGSIYDTSAGVYLTADEQVMSNSEDKFCSIANVRPASGSSQDLTRPKIEQMAQNRGSNWHLENIKIASMEQLLCMIELGTLNFQTAIGQGVVNLPWTTGSDTTSSYAGVTGSTASLGNGTGRATKTTTYEGGQPTEYTVDGKTSVCYRGVENDWGNIWKFIIDPNIYGNGSMKGGEPYYCDDFVFAENKNSGNYKGAGFTATNANGYVSAMGWSEECDWMFIASECLGNSSLPVGDYHYISANLNGYRIARLGGAWGHGIDAGSFYWHLGTGVGSRSRGIGGRLVYVPKKA